MKHLLPCFPGFKNYKYEEKNEKIFGFENFLNENIIIKDPISLKSEDEGKNFFLLTLVKKLELSMINFMRKNINENFIKTNKISHDYSLMFKLIANKQILFQSLYVINDICFYHNLSCIIQENRDINENNLLIYKEHIIENFSNFIEFFKNFTNKKYL